MADFLDEKRSEIGARLKELKPLVDEYERLRAAEAALAGIPGSEPQKPSNSGGAKRKPSRPKRAKKGAKKRGRPKDSGNHGKKTRRVEALGLVRSKPGITIPEIAAQMKIKQNYLYRVLPGLAEDGLVRKAEPYEQARGWYPKDAGK